MGADSKWSRHNRHSQKWTTEMHLIEAALLGPGDLIAPLATIQLAEVLTVTTHNGIYGPTTELTYQYLDADIATTMRVAATATFATAELDFPNV